MQGGGQQSTDTTQETSRPELAKEQKNTILESLPDHQSEPDHEAKITDFLQAFDDTTLVDQTSLNENKRVSPYLVSGTEDAAIVKIVGERVRDLRPNQQLDPEDLAQQTGLSQNTIHSIEAGRSTSGLLAYSRLAHALDVPLALLFTKPQQGSAWNLGSLICTLRRLRHLSSAELAERTSIPLKDLLRFEANLTCPTSEERTALEKALEMPVNTLTERVLPMTESPITAPMILPELSTRTMGLHIRTIRQSKGLSVDDLATRLDIDSFNLTRIEEGQLKPTLDTYLKIASSLDVDFTDLLQPANPLPEMEVKVKRQLEQLGQRIRNLRLQSHLSLKEYGLHTELSTVEATRLEEDQESFAMHTYQHAQRDPD